MAISIDRMERSKASKAGDIAAGRQTACQDHLRGRGEAAILGIAGREGLQRAQRLQGKFRLRHGVLRFACEP